MSLLDETPRVRLGLFVEHDVSVSAGGCCSKRQQEAGRGLDI